MKIIYSLRLDESAIKKLRQIQERDGVTVAEQVRRAIRSYLDEGPASRMVGAMLYGDRGRRAKGGR